MSKNLIRKGLAIGATAALAVSGFAALPANAAGLADTSFVSLAPSTGTEYAVTADIGNTFSLTSNEASSIDGTGRNLKFLVSDPLGTVEPNFNTTSETISLIDDNLVVALNATNDTITITDSDLADAVVAGSRISLNGDLMVDDGGTALHVAFKVANDNTTLLVTAVDTTANTTTIKSDMDILASYTTVLVASGAGTLAAADADAVSGAESFQLLAGPRDATAKTYVVNSNVDTDATDEDLVLQATTTATTSVAVTAWVDNNGNDLIDSTEYVSPTRTVTFQKASELAITSVLDSPVVGDKDLTGYATTVPVLNGEQESSTIQATFTRQGTADTETDAASWSNTTKRWSFSRALAPTNTLWNPLNEVGISAASSATTVLSITTSAAHGLSAGDKFVAQGLTGTDAATYNNAQLTVATAPTATTLTVTITSGHVVTNTGSAYLGGDRVVSGAYSMKATFDGSDGATQSNVVDAKTVATITNKVNAADGVSPAGDIRVGVKAASAQVTLETAAEAPVAGKQVRITITAAPVGTHYINGTKITANAQTLTATSNASGVVALAITSDTAAASNALDFTVSADGVTSSAFDIDWLAAAFSWVETTEGADLTARSVNEGGSYTLNVGVVDQWGKGLTGDFRIFATSTNRHVSAKPYTMSNGFAAITVTDDQVVGASANINVIVKLQKLVSGAWTDSNAVNAGPANLAADDAFVINTVKQTDVVLLDTDATTVFGSATADLSDSVVTAEMFTVANEKLANAGSVYSNGNGVAVTGRVGNSLSNIGRAGSTVTISGANDFLFVNGWKSATGSLTFIADGSGEFAVNVYSQRAEKDAVVTVTSNGVSKTVKVTFVATAAVAAKVLSPKSIKAGRTVSVTVQFLDKWNNLASATNTASISLSGPGWLTNETTQTSVTDSGLVRARLVTESGDFGPAVFSATTNVTVAGVAIVATSATWVGPIANAKAGAKAGRVIVEAYRAKGKTVNVFVGATRVATFTANKANFRAVVRGINSGTRNVSVRLSGPGEDFRGAITVK